MKKWNLLLSMFLMAGAVFVTSCTKDDETDPGPSITLKGGTEYVSADKTIQAGETITVGVIGASSTVSNSKLVKFKLTSTFNNVPEVIVDTTFSSSTFNLDITIAYPAEYVGENRLLFQLTDKGGMANEKAFIVTVEQSATEVNKYTGVNLGSWNDNEGGSFYSTSENKVYFRSTAAQNQSKIDFVFFKGDKNGNAIAAPFDPAPNSINELLMGTWTVKNKTLFQVTTMTAAQFDAIGASYDFPEFTGELTIAKQLAIGNVVYFKTVLGKLGYFKVVNLNTRGDYADLEVIVQK